MGVQFSNIFDTGYNLATAISMMFFDIFLYGFLAWYFNHVLPQEYGQRKHPLFFLFPSFWTSGWCCCKDRDENSNAETPLLDDIDNNKANEIELSDFDNNAESFETLSLEQMEAVRVKIIGLKKKYSDGKLALKHLNLSLVTDQITCLLGQSVSICV